MRSSRRFPPPPQSPITGSLRSGEPVLISELTEGDIDMLAGSEEHRQQIRANGARSLMIVPLVARGRTLGVITFAAAESGRRYDQEDLVIARELTGRAALAMDNAGLFQRVEEARGEAERRAREERALREAAEAVTASFTEEEIIQQIAQSALTATNADCTVVERIDIARGEVKIVAVAGDKMIPLGERVDYSGSLAEQVVERKESVHIPVVSEAHDRISPHLLSACSDCSALAVPLLDAGEAIGALILLREPEKWRFRPDEAERARTFANLAALAFRKVHLLEDSERKREELAQVMESRARLMRGFSHDVKNPLGAADGFLQLLEEGIMDHLTPRQEESVGRARSSLSSALRLIEDLLELARAEAGEITVEWTAVDTWEATREVAESYRAQAEGKGLSFQVELPDEIPVIRSDSDRIRQILGNLLSNAVKYTEKGGIRVRLSVREGGKAPGPGRWIAMDVADTGPGISADQQKHLFKEFRRLEATDDTARMGIGLAISRRITHALDAEITVESEVGRGSTFTLWLPLEHD